MEEEKNMNVEKAINILLEALKKVDKKYLSPKNLSDDKDKLCERCFAYEFYHQWRCRLDRLNEEDGPNNPFKGLVLNGEIPKNLTQGERDKYPDMILHGGQENTDQEKQVLACEIKRYSGSSNINNAAIANDLFKLCFLTSKEFRYHGTPVPFSCGIFIFANSDEEMMKNYIRNGLTYLKDKASAEDQIEGKSKIQIIKENACKVYAVAYSEEVASSESHDMPKKVRLCEILREVLGYEICE
ncbi:MAG: hypothetical protein K2J87_06320 [Muribaculaceae bacterium]|nr:hypothetical protein [Muribaculaceae bacterium]